ncbi:MAG TPA: hypothetical protein VGP47_06340 [Parachlamydiaceae bacterium]|nr:hypothetical protein [Parachlamydiaceae bacterium]
MINSFYKLLLLSISGFTSFLGLQIHADSVKDVKTQWINVQLDQKMMSEFKDLYARYGKGDDGCDAGSGSGGGFNGECSG